MATGGRVIVRDRGLTKILANMRDFDGKQIALGIQGPEAGAIHPDSELDNLALGIIHEFGAPGANIPARSPIRSTWDNRINAWVSLATRIAEKVYSTTPQDPSRVLGVLGAVMVADIQKAIARGLPPPLQAATIARKGSSVPLIDTSVFRQAYTFTVRG